MKPRMLTLVGAGLLAALALFGVSCPVTREPKSGKWRNLE